jgi:hypothetical protein
MEALCDWKIAAVLEERSPGGIWRPFVGKEIRDRLQGLLDPLWSSLYTPTTQLPLSILPPARFSLTSRPLLDAPLHLLPLVS